MNCRDFDGNLSLKWVEWMSMHVQDKYKIEQFYVSNSAGDIETNVMDDSKHADISLANGMSWGRGYRFESGGLLGTCL